MHVLHHHVRHVLLIQKITSRDCTHNKSTNHVRYGHGWCFLLCGFGWQLSGHQQESGQAQEDEEASTVGDRSEQDTGTDGRVPSHALHGEWYEQSGKCAKQ